MQTPRAQRTSTDAQTWEFSHHKFLRGRPDLLEEIKRKALEPDPSIKHRVELPGEVAAQLSQMREENRRVVNTLTAEKAKFERLALLTKTLYDVVQKSVPGGSECCFLFFFYCICFVFRVAAAGRMTGCDALGARHRVRRSCCRLLFL